MRVGRADRVANQYRISRVAESAAQTIATAPNPTAALRQFETLFRSELVIHGLPKTPPPPRRKPMA